MSSPSEPISECRSVSSFRFGFVRLQPHETAGGCRELAHDAWPRPSGSRLSLHTLQGSWDPPKKKPSSLQSSQRERASPLPNPIQYLKMRSNMNHSSGNREHRAEGDFFQRVYRLVACIPPGQVATYGQIAAMLGNPGAARTVGWAMQAASEGLPCHRVVSASGALSPLEVFGPGVQRARLENEGVSFLPSGRIDLKHHLWSGEDPDLEGEISGSW
jgi:methylated-DNA-protein-cysteine methyltransferase-like protein